MFVREDVEKVHADILLCLCAAMDHQFYEFLRQNPHLVDLGNMLDGTEERAAVVGTYSEISLNRRRKSVFIIGVTLLAVH